MKIVLQLSFIFLVITACSPQQIQNKWIKSNYLTELSAQVDTIEVSYIAWACPCPNWLPTEFWDSMDVVSADAESYCMFVEAANEKLKIPDEYMNGCCGNKMRLIGSYYTKKGYSRDYESPVGKMPEVAKVFRFTDIEIIKPYTIYDKSNAMETVVIEKGIKAYYE